MALNLTSYDPMLKVHYVRQRVFPMADLKNPTLGMMVKDPKAGGKHYNQPLDFENPTGGSATFAKALANADTSEYEDLVMLRARDYVVANIDNETMKASETNADAFMPAFKEINKAFKQAGRSLSVKLFRTKGGAIGRIASGTNLAAAVITLDDKADAFGFQIKMKVTFAAADGTGSERDSSATLTVSKVARIAGLITMTANLNTISGIADTDYIFREGDFALTMAGFASWFPVVAPTSGDSFFGVDRSEDDRMYGVIRVADGEPLDELLERLIADVASMGGEPDMVVCNPTTLANLSIILGAKARYDKKAFTGRAGIGFKGFVVHCGGYEVILYGDVSCPSSRLYVFTKETLTLRSAGDAPHFLNRTGILQQSTTADEYQVRVGAYHQHGCAAPCWNGAANIS